MDQHDTACQNLLVYLSDYIDGELSKEICAAIEKHLTDCSDCQVVVNTLRKTVDLYHSHHDPENVPTGVMQRLYLRLNIDDYLSR